MENPRHAHTQLLGYYRVATSYPPGESGNLTLVREIRTSDVQ